MRFLPALLLPLVLAVSAPVQAAELAKGDVAPDFSLQGSDGKTYKLSELKGKAVVIAWFPKAFTGGCTMECKSLAEKGNLIKEYDVAYFMASTDKPEDNAGFAKQQNADFPILSDPTSKTAEAYGVLGGFQGLPKRWTFYIGPDGKILDVDKNVQPKTSAEDMAANLGKLGVAKRQ